MQKIKLINDLSPTKFVEKIEDALNTLKDAKLFIVDTRTAYITYKEVPIGTKPRKPKLPKATD